MKHSIITITFLVLIFTTPKAKAQIINPGFETWSADAIVPTAMNPNSGNGTTGWWDFNYFNNSMLGGSPISVTRCTDTVHSGSYAVRLQTRVYTPTSWNMYSNWGTPFIGHPYNDTLGILFNGNVNTTTQTYKPGIPVNQKLTQYKFYYQYKPNGVDKAECRVSLLSGGTLVAGGLFNTTTATGTAGWQQATITFTYISALTPDTLYVLYSSSSLDSSPKAGSILWIDDVSVTTSTGIEQLLEEEESVTIFPNPTQGVFSIKKQTNFDKPQTIEIYNLLGDKIQTIVNTKLKSNTINLSDYPKGIYIVKIMDGENTISKKIVLQ